MSNFYAISLQILIRKKRNTRRIIKIHGTQSPNLNLTDKNIQSNTKTRLMFLQTITSSFRQTFKYVTTYSSRKGIVKLMGKRENVKQISHSGRFRHIQTYPKVIRHIQAFSESIQAYSEPCVNLAYSEPWFIQRSGTFRTRNILRILGY